MTDLPHISLLHCKPKPLETELKCCSFGKTGIMIHLKFRRARKQWQESTRRRRWGQHAACERVLSQPAPQTRLALLAIPSQGKSFLVTCGSLLCRQQQKWFFVAITHQSGQDCPFTVPQEISDGKDTELAIRITPAAASHNRQRHCVP